MRIPQNMEQMKSTQFCSLSLTGRANKVEHESNACYTPVK
jgi:ferritin-like metal-binding protein YciE